MNLEQFQRAGQFRYKRFALPTYSWVDDTTVEMFLRNINSACPFNADIS
jgi:hypothetical protein